jgi:hypothetical protein
MTRRQDCRAHGYLIPTGKRALETQRIDGRVDVMDVHVDHVKPWIRARDDTLRSSALSAGTTAALARTAMQSGRPKEIR